MKFSSHVTRNMRQTSTEIDHNSLYEIFERKLDARSKIVVTDDRIHQASSHSKLQHHECYLIHDDMKNSNN